MPAPLLGLGIWAGLLGGREALARRNRRRNDKIATLALDEMLGSGDQDLSEAELTTARDIALLNPQAALAYLAEQKEQNFATRSYDEGATYRKAQMQHQKNVMNLNRDKHNFEMRKFDWERKENLREFAQLQEFYQDPQLAAAMSEGDVYPLMYEEGPGVAPKAGTTAFNEAVDKIANQTNMLEQIEKLSNILMGPNRDGVNAQALMDPANPIRAEVAARVTDVLMGLKEYYNLGVLNGGDLEVLLSAFQDPTTIQSAILSNPEALLQSWSSTVDTSGQALQQALRYTNRWVGFDKILKGRAQRATIWADGFSRQREGVTLRNVAFNPGPPDGPFSDYVNNPYNVIPSLGRTALDRIGQAAEAVRYMFR